MVARFDGHRYIHCRWCKGRGCLGCEAEAEKAYKRAFPEGPKPVATLPLDTPEAVARAKSLISPDALARHFGPGGGGHCAFIESLQAAARGEPPETAHSAPSNPA